MLQWHRFLLLTCLISNHDRLEATRPAADLEALRKLETRTRVLVPLEALGHQSRRQARGPLQSHDPHSFQLLLSIILDFVLRFSGTGFFHLTCPFFLPSCRPPPPVQPGHLLGALDSELYCLLFAARHSLTFNLCRGPSHILLPHPHVLFPHLVVMQPLHLLPPSPTFLLSIHSRFPHGVDKSGKPVLYEGDWMVCNNFNDLAFSQKLSHRGEGCLVLGFVLSVSCFILKSNSPLISGHLPFLLCHLSDVFPDS